MDQRGSGPARNGAVGVAIAVSNVVVGAFVFVSIFTSSLLRFEMSSSFIPFFHLARTGTLLSKTENNPMLETPGRPGEREAPWRSSLPRSPSHWRRFQNRTFGSFIKIRLDVEVSHCLTNEKHSLRLAATAPSRRDATAAHTP